MKFGVYIQSGSEDELYETGEPPSYEAVEISGSFPAQFMNFIVFKPTDEPNVTMRVPIEHLIWISEEANEVPPNG